jgi:hypothetical protein
VFVTPFDGHRLEGRVTAMLNTVENSSTIWPRGSTRSLNNLFQIHDRRVTFGPYAFKVEEKQIVKEMRGGH